MKTDFSPTDTSARDFYRLLTAVVAPRAMEVFGRPNDRELRTTAGARPPSSSKLVSNGFPRYCSPGTPSRIANDAFVRTGDPGVVT